MSVPLCVGILIHSQYYKALPTKEEGEYNIFEIILFGDFFYIFIHLNFILWLYIYYDPRLNFPFTVLVNNSLDKN